MQPVGVGYRRRTEEAAQRGTRLVLAAQGVAVNSIPVQTGSNRGL